MSLFSPKPKDPFVEEMRRLQAKERDLARQMEKLQYQQNPEPEEEPSRPLVVIPRDEDSHTHSPKSPVKGGQRLRVEHRRARARFITACVMLAILALVIYRVVHG